MLIDADLSSLEVRVAAFLSQDKTMIQEIRNGLDMHMDNARKFFNREDDETRTLCKTLSFRILYGGSPYAFHMDYKMPRLGLKRWEEIVEQFYTKYHGLKRWQDKNYQLVCKQGFLVNPTGRILTFHKHKERAGVLNYNRAEVCNYPTQSFATADIVPLCMVVAYRRLQKEGLYDVKIINQIHDSIIFDSPTKDVDRVCRLVIQVFEDIPKLVEAYFGFPYNVNMTGEAKIGHNWNDMTKWKPSN